MNGPNNPGMSMADPGIPSLQKFPSFLAEEYMAKSL